MNRLAVILILLLGVAGIFAQSPREMYPPSYISFEIEQLTFDLSDSLMVFDGLFTFSNLSALPEIEDIYFPILVDNEQAYFDSLSVIWTSSGYPLRTIKQKGGFWFTLEMPDRSMETVRIRYQQKLLHKQAKYIVTTANSWAKALVYASYEVRLPEGKKVIHYPFDTPKEATLAEGKQVMSWEFHDFVPQRDLFIQWE
ncbi:MAG: hypothetical protein LHW52_01205 [Candidatus Cloacimonetes bacterium]|nr:hypothetical protein [Candidatus Cloacimonadota bacterium]